MFAKQGKKTLRDQVEDLAERIQPHVENAIDQITPVLEDARDRAGAAAGDARDKAAPFVSDAREKFVKDVVPAVTAAVAAAGEKAEPYADEALRRGRATAAAVKGEVDAPKQKKGSRLRKLVVFLGLAGLGAFVYKKLKGDDSSTAWQSSYQPAPAPTPPTPAPVPDATAATAGGAGGDPLTDSLADDAGGASPDEAVADAAAGAEMHEVTTPDSPVEQTDVSAEPDPKAPKA